MQIRAIFIDFCEYCNEAHIIQSKPLGVIVVRVREQSCLTKWYQSWSKSLRSDVRIRIMTKICFRRCCLFMKYLVALLLSSNKILVGIRILVFRHDIRFSIVCCGEKILAIDISGVHHYIPCEWGEGFQSHRISLVRRWNYIWKQIVPQINIVCYFGILLAENFVFSFNRNYLQWKSQNLLKT